MGTSAPRRRASAKRTATFSRWTLIVLAVFMLGWLMWAAVSWSRYGRSARTEAVSDEVRQFLPDYEVEELFQTEVNATAPLTFAAAEEIRHLSRAGIRENPRDDRRVSNRQHLISIGDRHVRRDDRSRCARAFDAIGRYSHRAFCSSAQWH